MFENLTGRLSQVIKTLRGQARITEENISGALREVQMALLEADVALPVVRDFITQVKERALGRDVNASLTPGQAVIKIVQDELIKLMGETAAGINLNREPPVVILLAGLQGTGKTTTAAKLGRWLKDQYKKRVMMASCDVYRPAAIEQLRILAQENDLDFFPSEQGQDPVRITAAALSLARKQFFDVLIIDSAGRLHVDAEMMEEIKRIHKTINPSETIFIVDSMTGQDAINAAKAFDTALPLTGIILTKVDGDARGGAALSVRRVTGKPILFLGSGEKTTDLTPFHPERIASRILGMGDVLSLIEDIEQKTDRTKTERLARKLKKGKGFNLEDFREQLIQMKNMGGLAGLMDKMPGMPQVPQGAAARADNGQLMKLEAIINSMTPDERRFPDKINGSRKKRIASGSGTQVQDVNRLLKQHKQMQKMMKKLSQKGGVENLLRGLGNNFPGGFRP